MHNTISKIDAARRPARVPMPRFRRASKEMSLTQAVFRILTRAATSQDAFAVFARNGKLTISNLDTDRCRAIEARWPDSLVGTYHGGLKVDALTDDLRAYFKDAD